MDDGRSGEEGKMFFLQAQVISGLLIFYIRTLNNIETKQYKQHE